MKLAVLLRICTFIRKISDIIRKIQILHFFPLRQVCARIFMDDIERKLYLKLFNFNFANFSIKFIFLRHHTFR